MANARLKDLFPENIWGLYKGFSGGSEADRRERPSKVLISCVGYSDPARKNNRELEKCVKDLEGIIKKKRHHENHREFGPIATFYMAKNPRYVYLLYSSPTAGVRNNTMREAMATKDILISLGLPEDNVKLMALNSVTDPTNHSQLIEEFRKKIPAIIEDLKIKEVHNYELNILTSPGTPQMGHCWIIIVASGFPATLYEVRPAEHAPGGLLQDRVVQISHRFTHGLLLRNIALDHFMRGRYMLAAEKITEIEKLLFEEEERERASLAKTLARTYQFWSQLRYNPAKKKLDEARSKVRDIGYYVLPNSNQLMEFLDRQAWYLQRLCEPFTPGRIANNPAAWVKFLDLYHSAVRFSEQGAYHDALNRCWLAYEMILKWRNICLYINDYGGMLGDIDRVPHWKLQQQLLGANDGWLNEILKVKGKLKAPRDDAFSNAINIRLNGITLCDAIRNFADYRAKRIHKASPVSKEWTENVLNLISRLIMRLYNNVCRTAPNLAIPGGDDISELLGDGYVLSNERVKNVVLPAIEHLI